MRALGGRRVRLILWHGLRQRERTEQRRSHKLSEGQPASLACLPGAQTVGRRLRDHGRAGTGCVRLRSPDRPWNDDVLDFQCELAHAGVNAATWIGTLDGDGIVSWAADLAESFHGWEGVRSWESLERNLRIAAIHDGRGHVSLRFIIRAASVNSAKAKPVRPNVRRAASSSHVGAGTQTSSRPYAPSSTALARCRWTSGERIAAEAAEEDAVEHTDTSGLRAIQLTLECFTDRAVVT
jgi:hypothetical protein